MSKEAEEFFRQKTIENAKRPRMKKFLALVNREAEGKILQEYADQQLRLYSVNTRELPPWVRPLITIITMFLVTVYVIYKTFYVC
tara:strand:+ start:254 stop:508 length:255 start_codon:yes stop_codon:yes gene_type:complete